MIDRRPGAVVRCRGASDVMRAVRLARDNGLLVAVRGGGHNIAGNAVCDGGLMIDLSPMRSVHIDPKRAHRARRAGRHARRVRQGGASLRPRHAARDQLDHRRRRAHAWRRLRLAQPQIRPDRRQSDLRRCRDRRRRTAPGERDGEPRPVLGHPRRRRQFRRRDLVRVQTASGRPRTCSRG